MAESTDPQAVIHQAQCIECGGVWTNAVERWRLYVAQEQGSVVCLLYCPDCAKREFE